MHYQTDFPPEQLRQCLMDDIGTAAVAVIGGAGATGAFDYFRQTNEFYYLNAARLHYYYAANRKPSNLPPNERTYTCHDFQTYGENDGPSIPRFELTGHHFSLWNAQDPRFQTLQGSEVPRINTLIQNDLNESTGNSGNETVF